MDKNVILQVAMGEDESLEIMLGDSFPTLVMVGLLEQVKLELLSNAKDRIQPDNTRSTRKFDA